MFLRTTADILFGHEALLLLLPDKDGLCNTTMCKEGRQNTVVRLSMSRSCYNEWCCHRSRQNLTPSRLLTSALPGRGKALWVGTVTESGHQPLKPTKAKAAQMSSIPPVPGVCQLLPDQSGKKSTSNFKALWGQTWADQGRVTCSWITWCWKRATQRTNIPYTP